MRIFGSNGFSIIELIVVIGIVAVLASIALPVYKTYVIRSKVLGAYNIVQDMQDKLIENYNKTGVFPTVFTYFNTAITSSSSVSVDVSSNAAAAKAGIDQVLYYKSTANSAYLQVIVNNVKVGINNDSTIYNLKHGVIFDSNGVVNKYCGVWPAGNDLPVQYLPRNCSCTNMNVVYSSGSVPSC